MGEILKDVLEKKGLAWCKGCGRTVFWFKGDKLPGAFECCKKPEYYGLEFKDMVRIPYVEGKNEQSRKTP